MWIFCHCIPCLALFSHLLKASLVRKDVKMGQDDLPSHRNFDVCMPWAFAAWLSEVDIKGCKWPLKKYTLTAPYLQKELITYRVEFWDEWIYLSFLKVLYALFLQHSVFSAVLCLLAAITSITVPIMCTCQCLLPPPAFSSNLHKNTCSILKTSNLKFSVLNTEITSVLSHPPSPAWCCYLSPH